MVPKAPWMSPMWAASSTAVGPSASWASGMCVTSSLSRSGSRLAGWMDGLDGQRARARRACGDTRAAWPYRQAAEAVTVVRVWPVGGWAAKGYGRAVGVGLRRRDTITPPPPSCRSPGGSPTEKQFEHVVDRDDAEDRRRARD